MSWSLREWQQRKYDHGFIRAVHYFGDGWPINCWSTMSVKQARIDFPQVAEDGFNTIILIIPWRGLQIEQFPPRYEKHYFSLLRGLLREARRAGLWVILRVSYSHHICDDASLISAQFTANFLTDASYQRPWLHHLQLVRRHTRFASNLYGSFLCWEEFWHGLMRFCEEPEALRRKLAISTGYADFMDAPNSVIPGFDEPEFANYHAFINARLRQIFELGREALPSLGYEFRVDKDPLQHADGSVSWLENDNYTDTKDLRYSYWAPFIGAANQGEELDATQALNLLDYNLREQTHDGANTGLIIDQFNFVDDTFKYTGSNARLAESEVEPFLQACAELLPRYCKGYGIWAWRDYFQNHLFNPGFQLGLKDWQILTGGVTEKRISKGGLLLLAGDEIGQSFGGPSHGMHKKYRTSHVEFAIDGEHSGDLQLEASLDGRSYYRLVEDTQLSQFRVSLPLHDAAYGQSGVNFSLRLITGSTRLSKLSLYQYAYRVGIRDSNGNAGPYLQPLREFNRVLAQTPCS
jgi:hypothetical protein